MDLLTLALIALSVVGVSFFFYFVPVGLWVAALSSGAGVGIFQMVAMRLRRVPPVRIVNPRISAVKAGLNIPVEKLEAHFLAGGSVENVVYALISANNAGIKLDFDRAAAIDLAGRSVLDAVKMSVNPRVIQTPKVAAVAQDGIQLTALSRVTVRANIERLVGGAGEDTILARVGEGIVSTIGSSVSHKAVLENPDLISKTVMQKGLDSGTAFEILSIDIADVDVGANIGAKLQIDQAEADKNIAQARAESRRAMAVAEEQEMKARLQQARAKVQEAEAQVPLALAEALRSGKIGAMDYYNLRNLVADTEMRSNISKMGGDPGSSKSE
ncbi:MAG: flotillin-like protein FloA [Deltaproteobacteria bacterium]|nr:flotillin-like protein FloA [Deltaproteobacteria bacterium]